MINPHNQIDISNKKLVLLYDNRQPIYGTDGVLFTCDTDGNIYRAIETRANIPTGTLLTDSTKWLKTDLISNQDSFNIDLGAVKKNLTMAKGSDLKVSVSSGSIKTYDSTKMLYIDNPFGAITNAVFDYIIADGTVIDSNMSEIDTEHWNDNGTKQAITRGSNSTFQKFYIGLDGKIRVLRGAKKYLSLARASYEHIDEDIPNLTAFDLYYIGGMLIQKNCTALDSKRCRFVYASKLCESHIGSGGGTISKLKEPLADITEIKAIESPESGEVRQDLSELPKVVLWAFNESATTGKTADDGTTGYWNKIEAETSRKREDKTADFTIECNYDYNVDCSGGDVTATISAVAEETKGKVFSIRKTDNTANTITVMYGLDEVIKIWAEKECIDFIYRDTGVEILSDYDGKKLQVDHSAVGRIVFQVENQALGVYALNGQTISDTLLAQHINNNSTKYSGFSVSGSNVTLPDMRGDILYGGGGRSLSDKTGIVVSQSIQTHHHSITQSYTSNGNGHTYEAGNGNDGIGSYTNDYGSTYTRTYGRTAQLCIVGTSYIKLDINSTLATPITVTFTGKTVNDGDSNVTIFEGISYHVVRVDLGGNKEIDTVSNAVILDGNLGLIGLQRTIGGGGFTVDITEKDKPLKYKQEIDTASHNLSTTMSTIKIWSDFTKKSGDVLELSYRIPHRNDSTNWGGLYFYVDYSIDGGTNWVICHFTGYASLITTKFIDALTDSFIVDVPEVNTATSVKFRFRGKSYTDTTKIVGDHALTTHVTNSAYTRITLKVIN